MRISILEPNSHGHTFTYVRHVVAAAERVGADFTVHCTAAGFRSAEFANHLGHLSHDHLDPTIQETGQGRFHVYHTINRNLRRVVATARPDVIVYPTADFAAIGAGFGRLMGRNPLSARRNYCLMTKLGFGYPGSERRLVNWLEQSGLFCSSWDKIAAIDVVAYDRLLASGHPIAKRLQLFPDPVSIAALDDDKRHYRAELGLDPESHIFVCPGIIRSGKGVAELVDGFLRLPASLNAMLVFAGPVREDVKRVFHAPEAAAHIAKKRIIVRDGSLSEEQLGRIILAADVTCCIYPKQNHPSSIAVTSLAYHRPVLYSRSLWIGEIGDRFEIGYACDPYDAESVAAAMKRSAASAASWKRSDSATRLIEFQSSQNFVAHWRNTFVSTDAASAAAVMSWDHVAPALG